MSQSRLAVIIGAVIFFVTLTIGWIIIRNHTQDIGFAEISGIVHAAMGIGFSSGFLSYMVLRALKSRRSG